MPDIFRLCSSLDQQAINPFKTRMTCPATAQCLRVYAAAGQYVYLVAAAACTYWAALLSWLGLFYACTVLRSTQLYTLLTDAQTSIPQRMQFVRLRTSSTSTNDPHTTASVNMIIMMMCQIESAQPLSLHLSLYDRRSIL